MKFTIPKLNFNTAYWIFISTIFILMISVIISKANGFLLLLTMCLVIISGIVLGETIEGEKNG